jgi:hypothetical protein
MVGRALAQIAHIPTTSSTEGSVPRMPSDKYAPKHRGAPKKPVRTGVRNITVISGVAVAATGIAVSSGVLSSGPVSGDGAAVALSGNHVGHELTPAELARREQTQVSRSSGDRMAAAKALKSRDLQDATGKAKTHTEDLSQADPHQIAQALMPQFGFSGSEYSCLVDLWNSESGWNVHADNPTSSAYGIPQALPGSKMASAGPDWANNPETQVRWGLGYIKSSYGNPCSAWSFKQGHGWY